MTALWRVVPEPRPRSTVKLTLLAGVWVIHLQGHKCGRADPATHLLWSGMGTEVMLPLCPLLYLVVRKSAYRVLSSGEQSLLPSSSTQESSPCTLPGQHCTAGCGGGVAGKPALKVRAWESWVSYASTIRCYGYWGDILFHLCGNL